MIMSQYIGIYVIITMDNASVNRLIVTILIAIVLKDIESISSW